MSKFSKMVVCLFVVSGVAFANPVKESDTLSISKSDKEFLFNKNDVTASTLKNDEMKNTNGKVIGLAVRVGVALAARSQYANAPTIGGKVYQKKGKFPKRRK